jgi:GNAT superfamily N-acetyltransferase
VTADFTNEELRARSSTCSGKENEGLLLFRVSTDDQECGLVLFNTQEDDVSLWIEELWILSNLRARGFGSATLAQAEEVATSLGRSKLAVWAEPLDDGDEVGDAKARLVNWYIRNGFTCSGGPWDELERPVSRRRG